MASDARFSKFLHCTSLHVVLEECLLPRTPGNCTERQRRWFFDPSENRCAPFYYTGCGGNKNNFESRDICEKFCPPARGKYQHTQRRTTEVKLPV